MRWGGWIFVLAGCTGELEQQVGLFEPIRVPAGEFIEEEIVEVGSGPAVTSIAAASGILSVGQQGRSLVGRTTADAYAVALRLEDVGTGWWVRPVQDEVLAPVRKRVILPTKNADRFCRRDAGGGWIQG